MNSHESTSVTRTRRLSRSATPHVLPAPAETCRQKAAEAGWKFLQPRSVSDSPSAASICRLEASDPINSIAASRTCENRDSWVDSEIRRVLIDCSIVAAATSLANRRWLSCSAARSRLLPVTSLRIVDAPVIVPVASLIGEMLMDTSRIRPSRVTRRVS